MVNTPIPRPWHGRRNDPEYVGRQCQGMARRDLLSLFDERDLETSADRKARQAIEWSAAGWFVIGVGAAICLVLSILAGG